MDQVINKIYLQVNIEELFQDKAIKLKATLVVLGGVLLDGSLLLASLLAYADRQ